MKTAEIMDLLEIRHEQRRAVLKAQGARKVRTVGAVTFGTFEGIEIVWSDHSESQGLVNIEMKDGAKFTNLPAIGGANETRDLGYDYSDWARFHNFTRYHRRIWTCREGEFLDVTISDDRFGSEHVA